MLALLFADTSNPSETILIWTLILTSLGNMIATIVAVVKSQLDRTQTRRDKESEAHAALEMREQARLDAESTARIALLQAQAREARITAKIDANTEISRQAFDVANGHNGKIQAAVEAVAQVAKIITEPKAIHVTVDSAK